MKHITLSSHNPPFLSLTSNTWTTRRPNFWLSHQPRSPCNHISTPHTRWQIRDPHSAGSQRLLLSSLESCAHSIRKRSYPSSIFSESAQALAQLYVAKGHPENRSEQNINIVARKEPFSYLTIELLVCVTLEITGIFLECTACFLLRVTAGGRGISSCGLCQRSSTLDAQEIVPAFGAPGRIVRRS